MSIKGYKVFNPDWTCRGFQYKVGETFTHNGNIKMCGRGFHFCRKASDCFNYYEFNSENKVAEIEALGDVETQGDKSVTDVIRIVREIEWHELLTIVNEGTDCTGLCNTGDCNTGNWNTGNCNTGFFNTNSQPLYMFNKPTDLTRDEILNFRGIKALSWNYENSWWIYSSDMTDEEKKSHPEHETTGGYLKTVDFKTACKMMWDSLDEEDKEAVRNLPNFDNDVFREITGISVEGENEQDK